MKRTLSALAIAAATLGSASVYAQNPQPSFQDSAPVPATQPATTVIVKQNFPQPSYQDNANASAAVVIQAAEAKPVSTSVQATAPAPSFNG